MFNLLFKEVFSSQNILYFCIGLVFILLTFLVIFIGINKSKIEEKYINVENIKDNFNKLVNLVVLIEKVRVVKTKNNDRMAFILASDDTGACDLTLFPKQYEKYKDIDRGEIILVKGQVQKRFDKYHIIINEIQTMG